jgi:4-hydroxy-tetrahydrodipicolinate reductase
MVRLSAMRPGLQVVAAYSRDPSLAGRDVGDVAGVSATGVQVADRETALATPADALLVATTSFMRDVAPDIRAGLRAGLHVVCTAEEMADPWSVDPALAADLDAEARRAGRTLMGVGANPGYIYEVVGLALSGSVWRVDRIRVRRVVDLGGFSGAVQRRLGVGYGPADFARRVSEGTVFGHIGFPHTIRTFARRMGVEIARIEERIEPIPSEGPIGTAVEVAAGESAGLHQLTVGYVADDPWFTAEFIGHVAPDRAGLAPRDSYEIDGLPDIRGAVDPGFDPQWTTVGAIANALPLVLRATPGLGSMTDLPIPTPWR